MKKIYIIMLIMVFSAFANNCKDWSNNSDNCLYDTTYTRPKFSNTENYMKIGDPACLTYEDKYYTYKDSIVLKNGLMVKIKLPRKICRDIEDISIIKIPHKIKVPRKKIDRSCCIRQACVGCSEAFIQNEIVQCYHGEWHEEVCSHTYFIDSTYYTTAYQIKYTDSANISFEYSISKSIMELSSDYYIDDNIIEIYRDDGTLRYKGELTYEPGNLEELPTYKTRGWCYNKTGTKETRKTNNVTLCK